MLERTWQTTRLIEHLVPLENRAREAIINCGKHKFCSLAAEHHRLKFSTRRKQRAMLTLILIIMLTNSNNKAHPSIINSISSIPRSLPLSSIFPFSFTSFHRLSSHFLRKKLPADQELGKPGQSREKSNIRQKNIWAKGARKPFARRGGGVKQGGQLQSLVGTNLQFEVSGGKVYWEERRNYFDYLAFMGRITGKWYV